MLSHHQTDRPRAIRCAADAFEIKQPIIVHSRADIASLLRAHRISQGFTCEQFDARAGWADRYVTKLENSRDATTGGTRQGLSITAPQTDDPDQGRDFSGNITASFMAEIWLETAGLRLVLMPAELAASIGAVPAPAKVVGR